MGKRNRRYRVGIDVGLYSVGLSAIEIDDSSDNPYEAMPLDILSIMSVIHDGALDPTGQKSADSRKAISGTARRTRRLFQTRRERYQELDSLLSEYGYPVAQASEMVSNMHGEDPYLPWRARISLVEGFIENDARRKLSLAIAMRHIARHRGWRNPYSSVNALKESALVASSFYMEFFLKVQRWLSRNGEELFKGVKVREDADGKVLFEGIPAWDTEPLDEPRPTVAELLEPLLAPNRNNRFRKTPPAGFPAEQFVHVGKLHQSDNYYELSRIFEIQNVPEAQQKVFFEAVFRQANPKDTGAAASLIAKDDLQPSKIRASRASLAFQRYRILTTFANLRIKQKGEGRRPLSDEERHGLFDYLTSWEVSCRGSDLTWHDVADVLGVERCDLGGVGGQTADGSPISSKQPPYLNTEYAILSCDKIDKQLEPLREWWREAEPLSKEFLIEFLGNVGISGSSLSDEGQRAMASVEELLADLGEMGEETMASLDKIRLSSGRVAYSVDTLERLNRRMLDEGLDLFEARKAEFGVENDWQPKANPLGTPTGNPAVDRTIKIASRWLRACEREWGKPETVFVEHVREGFKSEKQKREEQSNMDKRYRANGAVREEIVAALGEKPGSGAVDKEAIRLAEIRRWQAIQRQNGCCLYCGTGINFSNSQMDHIVPRKGVGCSNELPNLVAVCADCNASKNNTLFYSWASPEMCEAAVERVFFWNRDSYFSSEKQFGSFKNDVIARLKQKEEDDPIDARSIESVAWMALELRNQIAGHFGYEGMVSLATEGNDPFAMQRVRVFKGWITSEARKASGLEKSLPWIGSSSEKTRLDRRHHAVDAAVIAMMRPEVAKTLIERDAIRRSSRDIGRRFKRGEEGDWHVYRGADENQSKLYCFWRDVQMQRLKELMIQYMKDDRIVVSNPLRLRVGVGRAHKDTISKLTKRRVGDELSAAAIDKAETSALWIALTRQPDYDENTGLPANDARRIRLHDRWLSADDPIYFMASESELDMVKDAVYAPVRNGYAPIGDTIHHVRLYRVPKLNSKRKRTGWQYASLRVFQVDLVKHAQHNLFDIDLPMHSISVRSAVPILRSSLAGGTAEYLGWVVVGDELVVDVEAALFSPEGSQKMNKFMKAFPGVRRFSITGFNTNSKLTLAPRYFSSEGLPDIDWKGVDVDIEKTINRTYGSYGWNKSDVDAINFVIEKGCPLSIDKVLATHPTVMRRNALGVPRWGSDNNMPVSWKIPPHPIQ